MIRNSRRNAVENFRRDISCIKCKGAQALKYRQIYDVLKKSQARITLDSSGWRVGFSPGAYMAHRRPLWIVAEDPQRNLRLWITHEFGILGVTTVDTSHPINSQAYHKSRTHRTFPRQRDMAAYLEMLLLKKPENAA